MLRLPARNSAEKWKKTVNQLTLEDLKEYWEFHNRTEGKSEKTIKWYNEVLRLLELARSFTALHIEVKLDRLPNPRLLAANGEGAGGLELSDGLLDPA